MATEFGHDDGALRKVAELVAATKQDLMRQSQAMEAQLEVMNTQWVGGGGLSFRAVKQAWVEKHQVVTTALDRFEASLTETEADNTAVDQAAGAEMAHLLNRLGRQ